MWLLECLNERSRRVIRFYLLGGNSYSIGRKGSQLQLDEDDPSLSRHHATLMIMTVPTTEIDGSELVKALRAKQNSSKGASATANGGRGFGVLVSSDDGDESDSDGHIKFPVPEVILLDTSKHGCYVNNQRVNTTTRKANLTRRDVIRFGAHITARLTYFPIIATLSPTLTNNDVRDAVRILAKFGCFINNPKKSDALPIDAYSVDQLLTPQQRKLEAAMKEAYERRMQRIRNANSGAGGMGTRSGSPSDLALMSSQSFASGVYSNEVNQVLGLRGPGGLGRRAAGGGRSLSFAGHDDDTETAASPASQYSSFYGGGHSYEHLQSGGNDSGGVTKSTDELDLYGFEAQRNEVRARPSVDVSYYISPDDAKSLRMTPMMFVYVTNELEVGEPTAMSSMLFNYRPVDNSYLYTLYEAIFNSPVLAPSRWPEPRMFEHPAFADSTYYKPPLFHVEHQHFYSYSTTAAFRMCHFVFLQNNLFPRYATTITQGGGRATYIDPAKVVERLSNSKLYCNTSSVGETILGLGEASGGAISNASFGLNNASFADTASFGGGVSFAGFDSVSMRSFGAGDGTRSAIFSRSGRRKSRSRRTKKIPLCLKLLGIVEEETDAHGANLRTVVSSSVFQFLAKELQSKHGGNAMYDQLLSKENEVNSSNANGTTRSRPYHGDSHFDDGLVADGSGSVERAASESASAYDAAHQLPNVDPEVIDAAIHLFDSGYLLVHEDNIHTALYTHDTAAQIMPSSPGVLARSEIVDKAEETDSDATVEADSDDEGGGEEFSLAITPKTSLWAGGGGPLTHNQLVRDPILHRLHYAHMHREVTAQAALQVPVAAIRARIENGFPPALSSGAMNYTSNPSTRRRGSPPVSRRRF